MKSSEGVIISINDAPPVRSTDLDNFELSEAVESGGQHMDHHALQFELSEAVEPGGLLTQT